MSGGGGSGSHFCTGTSYLRDMARAPTLPGTDPARPRPAMRTCSISTGTATRCGHQGTSLPEGPFLCCEGLWITDTWDPSSQNVSRQKLEMWVCLCTYVCVCVCVRVRLRLCACVPVCDKVFLFLSSLPLAWGPPGGSLEL